MTTLKDIATIQARLIASFPNYHPADLEYTCRVWFEILGDLPADLLKMAVLQYSGENHDFAPAAGTMRDYCSRLRAKAAGIPDAYQAFDEVVKMPADMTKSAGEPTFDKERNTWILYTKSVDWSHPIVGIVARLMGWPRQFPTDQPSVDRAQFIKAYDAQVSKQMSDAARLPVVQQYIETESQRLLPEIKNLTKRLEGK